MTKEELQAKREQIAQEYVQVVNRVFCAEMAIQDKGGNALLAKANALPQGAERDAVCNEYQLMVSREIISKMPDKQVEEW